MKFAKRSSFVALFCAFFHFLIPAQNISILYAEPDALSVCNSDTFSVQIKNESAAVLTGASLTLNLPQGLSYVPTTVNGATQQNISNLMAPVFGLPDVPPNQSISVQMVLSADCTAADALDNGQLFPINIAVTSGVGNAQITTLPLEVETGAIIIKSVNDAFLSGERFDTLLRTICVKNTRIGKIGNLHFEDSHATGIELAVTNANSQNNGPTLFTADFDGVFFNSTGNGDSWLDQNEEICFTERIIINSCGTPEVLNQSVLKVGWGCGGDVCRFDDTTAVVEIKTSTRIPELVFEQIWNPPTDYCGNTPAVMGYKIKNVGKVDAINVVFNISLDAGLSRAGIQQNSFRIVSSSGTTPVSPNVASNTILPECGQNVLFEASFTLSGVPAKDSIEFLFDVLTCAAQCEQVQPAFRADYLVNHECLPNGFVNGNTFILPEEGYSIKGQVVSNNSTCLLQGVSYPFSYTVEGRYLSENGFIHIKLELPPGFMVNDSCPVLLGNIPPVVFETTPLLGGESVVHLAWTTPLPADSMNMDFCLKYVCDTNMHCQNFFGDTTVGYVFSEYCCLLNFDNQTYWSPNLQTPQPCAINACENHLLAIDREGCMLGGDGPIDTAGITPNYSIKMRDWFNVYRTNLGYRDQDDDRNADDLSKADTSLARRDRFLAGDTLRVEYCGVLDTVYSLDTLFRVIWHEIIGSDMAENSNDTFNTSQAKNTFVDASKFRYIGNTIRMRYADGTEAVCNWDGLISTKDKNYLQVVNPNNFPPVVLDDIATERFLYLYSLPSMFASGCLPRPYMEYGDSIFISTDFKIDVNFKPSSSNNPDPPLVGFRTATSQSGLLYAWNSKPFKKLQYSGWKKTFSFNTLSIKPCDLSAEPEKFRYSMRIARENLFPFEVRPLATISDYKLSSPGGLELASAKLDYLVLQDSVGKLSNFPLQFSQTPDYLDIDFAAAFADPVDEGFTLRSNLSIKPNCLFSAPDSSWQFVETSFVDCLNGEDMVIVDSLKNSIGYYSNTPRVVLQGSSILSSSTRIFNFNFGLKNEVVSPAPAAWIAVQSPSGEISDFELFQMPQNQAIAGNNGFFNLGGINSFILRNFRLSGKNLSCDVDSLRIIFGWSCAPLNSLEDADCAQDTFMLQLNLERPELELDIIQEPGAITLCDTSDWFEYEIYNAKTGNAYELESSLKLPQGLRIVSGSCQISYPDGAPWVNISDPALLFGNLYQWQINSLLPILTANGLPGVNFDPQNTFRIRFKTLAECGFVANTPIIYGVSGVEPCGKKSNLLNKPGDPVSIVGLNPSYGVQISLQAIGAPALTCGSSQEFSVNLNLLGTPSPGDSVYILLPEGVTVLPDTYLPGVNAVPGPITLTANGFQLALPILQGGGTVQFTFQVQIGVSAGCEDPSITAQTRVRTEAFCQSLGAPCNVYVSTGAASLNLNVLHPQLTAGVPNLSIVNGQLNAVLNISNIGNSPANGASLQIWQDLDGNGMISSADLLVQTLSNTSSILPGGTLVLNGVLPTLDSNQLCGLLFVLPALENCSCEDQIFQFESLQLQHTVLNICDLNPLELGVAMQNGFSYQWQPSNLLSCPDCPSSIFTPDPGSLSQLLTLTESSGNCTIQHRFEVNFGAVAQINVNNAVICQGNPVTLVAIPAGNTYQWQGPGITNPGLQSQTIKPGLSSQYSVTISFPNGCTAEKTVEITVLEADTVLLAPLSTCAGESVNVLGTQTSTAGTYQIVLEKANGCDSTIQQVLTVNPPVQTEEERVFCDGDSILVLDSLFTESGSLCQVFSSVNGCDSTHCYIITEKDPIVLTAQDTIYGDFGQIITLTGPNGFVTYLWEPSPTPPCSNCPTVSYPADSVGYQEYRLSVADIDGCTGDLLYRVIVFPPCSADSLHIPNAFTPNGDGYNDVFRVVKHEGSEVVSSLEIYDRWGEKVYENFGASEWDGTIDGKPAPSDVYVYIVRVTCGELIGKRVGDVTLVR